MFCEQNWFSSMFSSFGHSTEQTLKTFTIFACAWHLLLLMAAGFGELQNLPFSEELPRKLHIPKKATEKELV